MKKKKNEDKSNMIGLPADTSMARDVFDNIGGSVYVWPQASKMHEPSMKWAWGLLFGGLQLTHADSHGHKVRGRPLWHICSQLTHIAT